MNQTLAVCKDFEEYRKTYVPKIEEDDEHKEKIDDEYFALNFFSPNPTKIKEKGHTMTKNHDSQNLRNMDVGLSG